MIINAHLYTKQLQHPNVHTSFHMLLSKQNVKAWQMYSAISFWASQKAYNL